MSPSFNKLLTSPGEGELVAALDAASRRLGEGRGRDDWRPALAEIAESAEGRLQIESLPSAGTELRYVSIAWWTDHQGRKHVRVAGGNRYGQKELHHSRMDEDPRPPLWHVCPERVFRVKRDDAAPVWLASCACGERGTARELGWAGERCGPGHDRGEEGQGGWVDESVSRIDVPAGVRALAFHPDGVGLAVSTGERLSLFDLKTGAETVLRLDGHEDSYRPLTFSPDGNRLAAGGPTGEVMVWDMAGEAEPVGLAQTSPGGVNALAFSPCGRQLAVVGSEEQLSLLRITRGGAPDRWEIQDEGVGSIAFDPKGETLSYGYTRANWVEMLHYHPVYTPEPLFQLGKSPQDGVHYIEYTPDARHLIALTGDGEGDLEESWHLRRWSFSLHQQTHHSEVTPPSAIAMTPDGRYLAMLRHDQRASPAAVPVWDLGGWRPAGWVEWNPDDVLRCLDFSADGRWLATGSVSGVVKLYPWRSLLEG
ncbi:MAG: WD40 repeat domain-containing protein [Gemmataceae bacterium]